MPNLTPKVKDQLMKLDRHCEALGKEDPTMESCLKSLRGMIDELLQGSEKYTPEEFSKKRTLVHDIVVDLHFGKRGAEEKHGKKR
jgi:hypothetical protein